MVTRRQRDDDLQKLAAILVIAAVALAPPLADPASVLWVAAAKSGVCACCDDASADRAAALYSSDVSQPDEEHAGPQRHTPCGDDCQDCSCCHGRTMLIKQGATVAQHARFSSAYQPNVECAAHGTAAGVFRPPRAPCGLIS
jgi:hypothetical protein